MDRNNLPTTVAQACAVDRSCANSGCGCGPAAAQTGQRRGLRAAALGVLCVLGCLAVPIAIGGFAAIGGALAGEVWLIFAGIVIAAAVAIVVKRRGTGSFC